MIVLGIAIGMAAVGLYQLVTSEMNGNGGPSDAAPPACPSGLPAESVLLKSASDVNPGNRALKPGEAVRAGLQGATKQTLQVEGSTPGQGQHPLLTDKECTERWLYSYFPPGLPLIDALNAAWNSGLPFPDCAVRYFTRLFTP